MITFHVIGDGDPVDETHAAEATHAVFGARRRQQQARTEAQAKAAADGMIHALLYRFEAKPNEFELTAGSAVALEACSARLGMLDHDYRAPKAPLQRDYGVTLAKIGEYGRGEAEPREIAAYQDAYGAYLAAAAENPTGITAHKLRGTDLWVITPDEITAALGAFRGALGHGVPEPQLFWWPFWIAFLERAERVGIRVA